MSWHVRILISRSSWMPSKQVTPLLTWARSITTKRIFFLLFLLLPPPSPSPSLFSSTFTLCFSIPPAYSFHIYMTKAYILRSLVCNSQQLKHAPWFPPHSQSASPRDHRAILLPLPFLPAPLQHPLHRCEQSGERCSFTFVRILSLHNITREEEERQKREETRTRRRSKCT